MNKKKYLKSFITRVLISTILFLIVGILINRNDRFLLYYKNHVYEKSLGFNKFSSILNKYFKNTINIDDPTKLASKELNYSSYNAYKDGAVLNDIGNVYPFKSGIVVFIGNKEEYGNTIIIQGMDGVDYWYANIENVAVKLYDYVDSTNIIGNGIDNKLYVLFMRDNEVLNYEDYL